MHQQKAKRTRRTVSVETLENRTLLAAVPVISGAGHTIANGDTTPDQTDLTNFAWMYKGGTLTRQFVIQNTGDSDLLVSSLAPGGPGASAFKVVSGPTAPIAAGQSAPVSIAFTPSDLTRYDAVVNVQTNSTQTPTYTFAVSGSGIQTIGLAGGLRYGVVSAGTGPQVSNRMLLKMDYAGWLRSNGAVFDSTAAFGGDHGPFEFILGTGAVIKGWDRGLLGARVGESRVLFIPSALAYGAQDRSPTIPPNSDLIFQATVLDATPMSTWAPAISFAGQGHTISNNDKTWSATDATAFYSTGQPLTQNIVVDVYSSGVTGSAGILLTGPGAQQFRYGQPTNVGGQKYSIPITYTPVAGMPSDARFVVPIGGAKAIFKYQVALHGETLAPGVSFTGGALSVAGTGNNDVISLSRSGSYLKLKTNGALNRFNTDSVTSATLSGGAGDDKITVSNSVLLGVRIEGGDGRDTLTGGRGDDSILGGAGDDLIRGNLGNDAFDGGDGNDRLDGGAGNDTITGGLGQDLLIGGTGTNEFYADGDTLSDVLDARRGTADVGRWDDTLDVVRGVLTPLS